MNPILAVLCLGASMAAPPPPPPPSLPPLALTLRVTGKDFRWHILYPGPDGLLDTADDIATQRHLHLPAQSRIAIDLRSDDYVYSLHLPDLEVTELAVPGKPYLLQFQTENPGHYRLMGSQLCGYTHPELIGNLVVHTQESFNAWTVQSVSRHSGRHLSHVPLSPLLRLHGGERGDAEP